MKFKQKVVKRDVSWEEVPKHLAWVKTTLKFTLVWKYSNIHPSRDRLNPAHTSCSLHAYLGFRPGESTREGDDSRQDKLCSLSGEKYFLLKFFHFHSSHFSCFPNLTMSVCLSSRPILLLSPSSERNGSGREFTTIILVEKTRHAGIILLNVYFIEVRVFAKKYTSFFHHCLTSKSI